MDETRNRDSFIKVSGVAPMVIWNPTKQMTNEDVAKFKNKGKPKTLFSSADKLKYKKNASFKYQSNHRLQLAHTYYNKSSW